MRFLALLAILLGATGCAPTCEMPLTASVTVEETGETLGVEQVWVARSLDGTRRSVGVDLVRGQTIFVDIGFPPPFERALSFERRATRSPKRACASPTPRWTERT